jgi:altronate dehydratase
MSGLSTIELISAIVSVMLTWLIVMLGVVKISQMALLVKKMEKSVDMNLSGIASQMQKLQTIAAELLKEQRRSSRLISDLIDLKKAEMTGEFEIVETPIVDTANIEQGEVQ